MRGCTIVGAAALLLLVTGCQYAGSIGAIRGGVSWGGPVVLPTPAGAEIPNVIGVGAPGSEPVVFFEVSSPELRLRGAISGSAAAREFDNAVGWIGKGIGSLGALIGLPSG